MKWMGWTLMLLLSVPVLAESSQTLDQFFSEQIAALSGSLASITVPDQSTLVLQDISVDVSASIKYGIPDVVNISVSPDISFAFAPASNSQ